MEGTTPRPNLGLELTSQLHGEVAARRIIRAALKATGILMDVQEGKTPKAVLLENNIAVDDPEHQTAGLKAGTDAEGHPKAEEAASLVQAFHAQDQLMILLLDMSKPSGVLTTAQIENLKDGLWETLGVLSVGADKAGLPGLKAMSLAK